MGERAPLGMGKNYSKRAAERIDNSGKSGLHRINRSEVEGNIEHIVSPQHLIAYLETSGNESHKVESTASGWKPDEIREHAQWLRERVGEAPVKGSIEHSLPIDVQSYERHLYNNQPLHEFRLNVFSWEPKLLDDLKRAEAKNDPEAIQDLRSLIRAGSWNSHRPINANQAKNLAEEWRQKLLKQPTDAQLELTAVMNPDLSQVEDMLSLFSLKNAKCGPEAEKTAQFIEDKLREAWLAFNACYRETTKQFKKECHEYGDRFDSYPLAWPFSRNINSIEKSTIGRVSGHTYDFAELHDAYHRIIELRQLRDQVYYQLLYPKLCSFIKRPKQKHTA